MERIGDYEFDKRKELGKGAFGTVYEGWEKRDTKKRVAIKVIKIDDDSDFERELNMLKEISKLNHENFVRLLNSKKELGEIILVMELCNEDMASYLRKRGKLPENAAATFARQIVVGLQVLDAHRIIHRDLKPQNLLLTYKVQNPKPEDVIVKIADFGLARFLPNEYFQQLTQCGTICYMAPETLASPNYNSKADIWSVGLIIHEMMFGPIPFLNILVTVKDYSCPRSVSSQAQDALNRMLREDPAERIDIQSLAGHPFLSPTFREKLMEQKKKYLPKQMSRIEKQKLYKNAVGLPDILAWYVENSTNKEKAMKPLFNIDDDINKKVSIWQGDITKLEVDAIVNSSNPKLENSSGGANRKIHDAAGPQLEQETKGLIGGCDFGSAEVSAGYKLPAYYVIHTVGPKNHDGTILSRCYESCMQKVLDFKIRTVAFPAISTGNKGFPAEDAAKIALKTVREWLQARNNTSQVDRVIFVCFTKSALEIYNKYMPQYFPKV